MAHPVRPDSYIKMDNFYTVTVYEKGAEVVRLYETVLGKTGFRKGMDLYFKRHDGQAVTCDDFLAAMADANGAELEPLARWYSQAGTPELHVSAHHDAKAQTLTLKLRQRTPATPGQDSKVPVLIPVRLGLLGADGKELPLVLGGKDLGTETVLRLDRAEAEYVFERVPVRPVPSLLRGFSAPVKMEVEGQTDDDLLFLFAHDTDAFNRFEAGQTLARQLMHRLYEAAGDASLGATAADRMAKAGGVSEALVSAFRAVLGDASLDGSFLARAVSLPAETEVVEALEQADPIRVHEVRDYISRELARRLQAELRQVIARNDDPAGTPYSPDAASAARRAAKNKALGYLSYLAGEDKAVVQESYRRFKEAGNMTDEVAALACLVDVPCEERERALSEFFAKYEKEPLVILKWLSLQAFSNIQGNTDKVKALMSHPAFHITNPNNCYSLFIGYSSGSVSNFHKADGSGYRFMADVVLQVDKINPQVASRIVGCFTRYRKYDKARQALMRAEIERLAKEKLSENVFEIVQKCLDQ